MPAKDPRLELLYFSFVTLTTVGYGDITPLLPAARSLAISEALVGQLFPAVLIGRLVSMELLSRSRDSRQDVSRGREAAPGDAPNRRRGTPDRRKRKSPGSIREPGL